MNYRFYNARILTMATDKLTEGELWVQDGKILYVGDGSNTESVCVGEQNAGEGKTKWDREIDCEGNLLISGNSYRVWSPDTVGK